MTHQTVKEFTLKEIQNKTQKVPIPLVSGTEKFEEIPRRCTLQ